MTVQPIALGHLDGDRSDPRAARLHENGLARLELRIVEQHVLDGGIGDGCARRVHQRDARRHGDDEALVDHHPLAGESVDMEAHHTRRVLAEIVAPRPTGRAGIAGQRAIHHDRVARPEPAVGRPRVQDLAGSLHAHGQRQPALGEGHAAKAPQVQVIEPDRLDRDLHLAGARRRRIGNLDELERPVGDELQCPHRAAQRWMASAADRPPSTGSTVPVT